MINGTVVLLAAIVVLALALVVWFLLRRRDASGDLGAEAYAARPGGPSAGVASGATTGWAAAGQPREDSASGVDTSGDPTAAGGGLASDGPRAAREPRVVDPDDASDDDSVDFAEDSAEHIDEGRPEAEGAEFAGDGLSTLESDEFEGRAEVSGSPPRTPTEAFGAAEGSSQAAAPEELGSSKSLLDGPDSDSTPLFRSIRERLMGSAAGTPVAPGSAEASTDDEASSSGEAPADVVAPVEDAPVEDVEPAGESAVLQRRVSELHEVVDGGFGIGSAAPIADGAQPLGHPIKADRSTRTYQDLHSPAYEEADPDVWFLDPGFAERAGFRRAD